MQRVVFKQVVAGSEEQAVNKVAWELAPKKKMRVVDIGQIKNLGPWQGSSDKMIFDVYAYVKDI